MSVAGMELPTGNVTFFFSDVQDSTGLLQRLGSGFKQVIEQHAAIIRRALSKHNGIEVSTEGDSFFAVFEEATQAVAAAGAIQLALDDQPWPAGGTVAVRIGLHSGTAELGADNYLGLDVNRAARISAAGHGGQVVFSEAVLPAVQAGNVTDLGEHALRGLQQTEHLYQLNIDGLPQAFPPLRTQTSRPNNLPALTSQIVGRDTELATLQELIVNNRLVTLTGPGGIGKTRLALEAVGRMSNQFEEGVFLVELASVTDPDLVPPTIASTMGIADVNGELGAALANGPRLLLLDNFEQVAAASPSIGELLASAPPLKLLVTSQVPLRLGNEQVFRLDPLAADAGDSPAVELFAERARQVDPTFDLDAHRPEVRQLVASLDGVPLAIELAAARSHVLSPAEISARLGPSVLKTARADGPERHSSITAAVEWSYSLLEPGQQATLDALSVFRGGATLAGLEAVSPSDPLEDLSELVDRSLVETEMGQTGKRFTLLAPVRLFVRSRPVHGDELAASHAAHFQAMCQEARLPLEGDGVAHWLAVLEDEHDNISAALDHFLSTDSVDEGFALLGSAWRFYHRTGRLAELDLWLGRFFAAGGTAAATIAKARALVARAGLHYWRRQWKQSVADYESALAIAEQLGEMPLVAEVLSGMSIARGMAMNSGDDLGDPFEPGARARDVYEEIGDRLGLGTADFTAVFFGAEPITDPIPTFREKLLALMDTYADVGPHLLLRIKLSLSEIFIAGEEYDRAREITLESLNLAEESGDIFYMGMAMRWLGVIAVERGDAAAGARFDGAGAGAMQKAGGAFPPTIVPIESAIDRARAAIGEAADKAYADGKEVALLDAAEFARRLLQAG